MVAVQRFRQLLQRNRTSIHLATRNAVVVSAGVAVAKLLAFAYSTLLARVAGAETFGEFTLFTTIFLLVSEVPAAFDVIYIRFANSPENTDDANHHLMTGLLAKGMYLLVIVAGGWFAAPKIALLLGKTDSSLLILYAITGGALYSLYLLLIADFQRRHRFALVGIYRVVFPAAILLGVLGIGAFSGDELGSIKIAAVFTAIAGFLGFAAAAWIIYRSGRFARFSMGSLLRFLRVSSLLLLAAAIGIFSRRLDVFVLSSDLDFADLGQYGVALRICVLASFLTVAITTILVPKAVAAMHDARRFRRYLGLAAFYSVLQTMFALVVIYFMGSLVMLLFGQAYESAVHIGVILIIQVLLLSYGVPFKALVQAGPKPSYMIWTSVIRLVAGWMLLGWWVPAFGLQGAAAAVTVSEGIITILLILSAFASRRMMSGTKPAKC